MIQALPERDQLAFVIAEAMWGTDSAASYARTLGVRWEWSLRAADAVMTRQGRGPQPPARLYRDSEREGYAFLQPQETASDRLRHRYGQ